MNSHKRWFLHMSKQIVLLMCSYQHASDAPNAINGQTLLGATLLNTYWVPCSPLGTGKYGCTHLKQTLESPKHTHKTQTDNLKKKNKDPPQSIIQHEPKSSTVMPVGSFQRLKVLCGMHVGSTYSIKGPGVDKAFTVNQLGLSFVTILSYDI